MHTKKLLPVLTVLLALTAGCKGREPESQSPAPATDAPPATAPATTTETTTAPPAATPPAPQAGTAATPAAAASLASQQTNWPGIVADLTEFRRKGSTLTARVVLRNQGSAEAHASIHYDEVYLMDAAAGRKYEALKDEKGTYIAALRSGYKDQWYDGMAPGATYTLWIKFPAPPPDVKTVTLQLPGMPPFEDLAIQDL